VDVDPIRDPGVFSFSQAVMQAEIAT